MCALRKKTSTLVRLREGDEAKLTVKLTSFADSLFYNRELGGHRVSFGVNVGYLLPFVSSSASGGFTGSPINYSLGDSREDVSYTSQSGFTVGLMADFKLYKNFYLIAGVNYTQYKYQNKFNEPLKNFIMSARNGTVYRGDLNNSYKESYTVNLIEVSILASYRFVLTKTGSLHLNLGPYISYGLSAKMKLSGSTDVTNGNIYAMVGQTPDYSQSFGTFVSTYHTDADIDMYAKDMSYTTTAESGANLGFGLEHPYNFDESPYNKLNYGLKLGATYELRGFQLGVAFNYQLSNMANKKFWESARMPIFNNQVGQNNMSGYKHRLHSLEIKLGYTFRY